MPVPLNKLDRQDAGLAAVAGFPCLGRTTRFTGHGTARFFGAWPKENRRAMVGPAALLFQLARTYGDTSL